MLTLGELIAHRRLEKEDRAGVPQYTTGQHAARLLAPNSATLTFVDTGGHVCLIPCAKEEDDWQHMGASVRVGQSTMQCYTLTRANFVLTDKMKDALAAAEKRYKAKRTRDKKGEDE